MYPKPHGSHPPIIARRCFTDPCMQPLLVKIVRKCGVCYGLKRNIVSLPKEKCGPLTSGRVSREVHIRPQALRQASKRSCPTKRADTARPGAVGHQPPAKHLIISDAIVHAVLVSLQISPHHAQDCDYTFRMKFATKSIFPTMLPLYSVRCLTVSLRATPTNDTTIKLEPANW